MKKVFFLFILFLFFSLRVAGTDKVSPRRHQALAIGQLSLAVRLINLSLSLSVAKATSEDSILSLLSNLSKTLKDCKKAVSMSKKQNKIDNKILSCTDTIISCSEKITLFISEKSSIKSIKKCSSSSVRCVSNLSDVYNNFYKNEKKKEN